jgi:ABC-type polysaccharide/polyol phosphate export permease
MSGTVLTPAGYRSSAGRPNPLRLLSAAAEEAWSRRRLIRYLVSADLRKKGADTLLGNLWWVIDPLLQMAVYVVLVSVIFDRSTPDYPLFIFAAILPWKWFTSTVSDGVSSVTSQERLIKQLQFPKIVLPVAATFAGVVNFAFGMIPLLALMLLFYPSRISPFLLAIPVVAVVQLVLSLAIAFAVAAINVFFRDLGNVTRHVLRLWFYLSPGLYSVSQLENVADGHPVIAAALWLNPFTILFEGYRAVIYGSPTSPPGLPGLGPLAVLLLASLGVLALTTILFKRVEPSFAKVL